MGVQKTWQPVVAGWLDILAGVLWLLAVAALTLVILGLSVGFGTLHGTAVWRLWAILLALALPGFLAIAGGISSLKRRRWLLVLIGSIGVIPAGFGIVSVILLVRSKSEFT